DRKAGRAGYAHPARIRCLGELQVRRRHLAVAAALEVVGDLLAFREMGDAGALERGHVDEGVLAAVARLNETKALAGVVELDDTVDHCGILSIVRLSPEANSPDSAAGECPRGLNVREMGNQTTGGPADQSQLGCNVHPHMGPAAR